MFRSKPKQLNLMMNFLNTLDNQTIINIIFLKLTKDEVVLVIEKIIRHVGLVELAKMLPHEEYFFLVKEAVKILGEITIEEAHELFHVHKRINMCDYC